MGDTAGEFRAASPPFRHRRSTSPGGARIDFGLARPWDGPAGLCWEFDRAHWRDRKEGRNDPPVSGGWPARARHRSPAGGTAGRRPPRADRDGYTAVQLGAGKAKAKNVAKPQRAAFGKAKVEPKVEVAEFRVAEDALLDVGATISADHFVAGQIGRRLRRDPGQGLRRSDEAMGLQGSSRHPRRLGLAPLARLDRTAPGSGQGFQEQEDGGPHGRPQPHPAEPRGGPHGPGSRADFHQGIGARVEGRLARGRGRDQVAAPRRRALSGRPGQQGSAESRRPLRRAWSTMPRSTRFRRFRATTKSRRSPPSRKPAARSTARSRLRPRATRRDRAMKLPRGRGQRKPADESKES